MNGGLVLEDCASRHGTFVNGEKVLRHELKPNDKIDFGVAGSYQLIYLGEGATTIAELVERVARQRLRRRVPASFITWVCCWT